MKGYLTANQIEYVMFHLNLIIDLKEDIRENFVFHKGIITGDIQEKIVFQLSKEPYSEQHIVMENEIPVLFPVQRELGIFQVQNGGVIFHYDLLKSAFFLLSGYQERSPEYLDSMDRYPHDLSLQSNLKVTRKPLVNYYLNMIAEGIREYCKSYNIKLKDRLLFKNGVVFITHDIDIVDTYAFPEVIFKIKQALRMTRTPLSWRKSLHMAFHYIFNYLNFFSRNNPHWDFPFIREVESEYGLRSAFFFLPNDKKNVDAYYTFNEPRLKQLFLDLDRENCEIGLHGTVRSATSLTAMKEIQAHLKDYSPQEVRGIRQHRLMYDFNSTPVIHHQAGFQYDTSLGFAEHEGFRNSFCLPFRLYDHESDQMLDHWEIPLTVMDVTLFHYKEYSIEEAMDALEELFQETIKFNGVITFLWHNGRCDDVLMPGMKKFYLNLMKKISTKNMENLLGYEIINRIHRIYK